MLDPVPERRQFERIRLQVTVFITTPDLPDMPIATHDVSPRGVCLYLNNPLPANETIEFRLVLPPTFTRTEAIELRCRGRVLRIETTGAQVLVAATINGYELAG